MPHCSCSQPLSANFLDHHPIETTLTKEIYIFSGLGADERVFQNLDFTGFSEIFINWIIPESGETIENYSTKLLNQIKSDKPTLIGLSFGGLIAIEVAKQIQTETVIIISSAKTKSEIPFYYRWMGIIGMQKLIPVELFKKSNLFTNWFFGTTSDFDKQLLKSILFDTEPTFLKWAIEKIVTWENKTEIINLKHIHGTKDRILPIRFVSCDIKIEDGSHLMILNKSEELTKVIKELI